MNGETRFKGLAPGDGEAGDFTGTTEKMRTAKGPYKQEEPYGRIKKV